MASSRQRKRPDPTAGSVAPGSFCARGGGQHERRYSPLRTEAAEPTKIEAADACGMTKARVSGNLDRQRLRVAHRRLFVPSPGVMAGKGRLMPWPGDRALAAMATAEFQRWARGLAWRMAIRCSEPVVSSARRAHIRAWRHTRRTGLR
jgi:hypothetical protein